MEGLSSDRPALASLSKTACKRLNENLRICSSSSRRATAARAALDALIRRYTPFVRLKASAYFLVGGGNDDLIQEGLIGLYKAVARLSPRQGDVVPLVRRALRDAPDHHRDQERDAVQALPAEQLRLLQPHARRAGSPTATARSVTRSPARTSTTRPSA